MADDRVNDAVAESATDAGADTVAGLRAELARLAGRLAALEAVGAGAGIEPQGGAGADVALPMAAAAAVPPEAAIADEILIVIAAAVAAYLGNRPRIRQVTLIGSTAWAQQGRATNQASHMLPFHHPQGRP